MADQSPIFGDPAGSSSSNLLSFPNVIQKTSAGNGSWSLLDATLHLTISTVDPNSVHGISAINITESGDYFLKNNSAKNAYASVSANIGIGRLVYYRSSDPDNPVLLTQDGTGVDFEIPASVSIVNRGWALSLNIDLLALTQNVTDIYKVDLSIDNILTANTTSTAMASISKKYFTVDTVTHAPEPGTLVLLGMAALGFVGFAWRKGRKA